ncbi:MAG: hypothetical protein RLZZ130_1005 [Pseudomonadota bacterium]|jgi:hypothetical protein
MFKIDQMIGCCWPNALEPRGEGTFEKEAFAAWWERNQSKLTNLPADLCEQWIFRHWTNSPFTFLPLDSLAVERNRWEGDFLLKSIYRAFGGELSVQFDYDTFQGKGGDDRLQTAKALDSGTWDYPMVLLSTPAGVMDLDGPHPNVRYVIVEGHQRHRYLNALHALGKPPTGPHEVLILSSQNTIAAASSTGP